MAGLGELVKNKRRELGLSLREFAQKCKISHSYIRNLESGDPRTGKEVLPTIEYLEKLMPVLEISLTDLLREIGYEESILLKGYDKKNEKNIKTEGVKEKNGSNYNNSLNLIIEFINNPNNSLYLDLFREIADAKMDVNILREKLFSKELI